MRTAQTSNRKRRSRRSSRTSRRRKETETDIARRRVQGKFKCKGSTNNGNNNAGQGHLSRVSPSVPLNFGQGGEGATNARRGKRERNSETVAGGASGSDWQLASALSHIVCRAGSFEAQRSAPYRCI